MRRRAGHRYERSGGRRQSAWIYRGGCGLTNMIVVSVRGRHCLVVPGVSSDISGFTPDSSSVIVRRTYSHGTYPLREFDLSSLRATCPKGPEGILPRKS